MNRKEALDILQTTQAGLCYYVRKGQIRCSKYSTRKYDYSEEDVRDIALKRESRKAERDRRSLITPEQIAEALGLDISMLRKNDRSVALVDQRRIMASVMKAYGYTQSQTGKFLDRDHSTVAILLKSSYLVQAEIRDALYLLNKLGYGKETTQEL